MASRLERLIGVGKDLNAKMKLDPPIDTDTESAKELKQRILTEMEAEDGQLYETDVNTLDKDTWEYLTETLEITPRKVASGGETAPTKSPDKEGEKVAVKKKAAKKAAAKKKAPAATATKKVAAKKKAAPAPAKKREVDEYGFRPGTKKSEAMKLIAKGKTTYDKLKEKFGGQVNFAMKEAEERTNTVCVTNEKSGIVSIKKAK